MSKGKKFIKSTKWKIRQTSKALLNDERIPSFYHPAIPFCLRFIQIFIIRMVKEQKIYITLELYKETACWTYENDSLIWLSKNDFYGVISHLQKHDNKQLREIHTQLQSEIDIFDDAPQRFTYDYSMFICTIFLTTIYLMFSHEAMHAHISAKKTILKHSHESFEEELADQYAGDASRHIITGCTASLIKAFPDLDKRSFKITIILTVLTGVLFFSRYITRPGIQETLAYPPHSEREFLAIITAILENANNENDKRAMYRNAIKIHSKLHEYTLQESLEKFNLVATKYGFIEE